MERLGEGTYKIAYRLNDERVIMLPNYEKKNIMMCWEHMVEGEVYMSQQLNKLGLLSLDNKKVILDGKLGYISYSFEHLAKNHYYVIEKNEQGFNTWRGGLFKNVNEMRNIEKWREILRPLEKDIEIMFRYYISSFGDSLNFVLFPNYKCGYSVRYLGFDFTFERIKDYTLNYRDNNEFYDEDYKMYRDILKTAIKYIVESEDFFKDGDSEINNIIAYVSETIIN